MAATKEKFDAAVKVIQSIPPNGSFVPSQSMMLKFYAYYKQATEGPCNIPRPSFWEVIAKAKWDAWNGLSDMPPHEAMANYVEELKKAFIDATPSSIIEAMPHTEHVQGFVEKLGDFYEAIDELPPGFDKKPKYWMNSNGDLPKVTEVDVNGSSDSGIDGEELGEILSAVVSDQYAASKKKILNYSDDEEEELTNNNIPSASNGMHEQDEMDAIPFNDIQSSDGEDEFCDTSDMLQPEAEAMLVKASLIEDSEDPEYTDQSNGSISNPTQSDDVPIRMDQSQVTFSFRSGITRDPSATNFPMSPDQLYDRNFSSRNLSELENPLEEQHSAVEVRGGAAPSGGSGSSQGATGRSSATASTSRGASSQGSRRSILRGGGGAGGGGNEEGGGARGTAPRDELVDQLAVTVMRLQKDMSELNARLKALEERKGVNSNRGHTRGVLPWWIPFPRVERRTLFFVLIWPFIVHAVISFMGRRKRRR